ncbi:hypothetical protein C4577_06420 [Candidatus Parcubacteria bacterium]|nr:MAG: hypothetical protein C4577_06420 [Candidatus Parcubacteria bacterium]
MGVNKKPSGAPRRAYYPSGPWVGGIRPVSSTSFKEEPKSKKKKEPKLPNPDPNNYKIVKAEEVNGYLILMINYPDCTNYEGNKILLFKGVTLLDIVNQKYIDPHFFEDSKIHSPIARFVPTGEGWKWAKSFAVKSIGDE